MKNGRELHGNVVKYKQKLSDRQIFWNKTGLVKGGIWYGLIWIKTEKPSVGKKETKDGVTKNASKRDI